MADKDTSRSMVQRLIRGVATLLVTTAVVAVAGFTTWQGSTLLANRAAAVEKPAPTELIAVSVSPIVASDGYSVERSFTGQIEAPQTADISFEQGGTLKSVLVDEGDAVSKGDIIAQLDDRLLKADIDRLLASKKALQAQSELARLTDERQAELRKKGFASAQTADQSRLSVVELNARIAELDASILAAEIRFEKTVVRAPFEGRINTRSVDPGNAVGATQTIVSMVDDGPAVFRVGIAPSLAQQLKPGQTVQITFDDLQHDATIISILPQIDPVTRTRIVRAQLDTGVDLAFGMTGAMALSESIETPGSWIPLTAIEDGVRGLWTIKTISDSETPQVELQAVELIHADGKRAYVRGTFDADDRYINEGVHRVVSGQHVRVEG